MCGHTHSLLVGVKGPAVILLVSVVLLAPALESAQADGSRAPPDAMGGFKTDEVALESSALALCSGGSGVMLAYYGTFNTAPSVVLMRYTSAGSSREQVAAKYPFAVAVASEPAAGGRTVVSYITNTVSGPQVNLAENRTGTWASTAIAYAKPAGRINSTGVAMEPGGATHVIFLNATHLGHHSNGTLSYLPADQVAPSIAVSPAGGVGIALASGGALLYATPWANSTGFDARTVTTSVRPAMGSRLALVHGAAGGPAIFFTSGGSAQMASLSSSWDVSPVASGTVLAAAAGADGMHHVLVERSMGGHSDAIYISGDGVGEWLELDLGQCRPGYPAGIAVTPEGIVHIAVNTALQGLLHGYRGAVPGPVRSLGAAPGNRKVTITWQPPADGTVPVLGYLVRRGTDPAVLSTLNDSPTGTTEYTDRDLTNDVTYHYSVTPYNEYGESRSSPVIDATPRLSYARVPGATGALTATAELAGGIALGWAAPSDDGGDAIAGYRVYRGTDVGAIAYLAQTAAGVLSYADKAVTAGTTYHYRVSALNGVGEGEQSNIADCTAPTLLTKLDIAVTPQRLYLVGDSTTYDIYVTVTADGKPVDYANVKIEVVGSELYTGHANTDANGKARWPGYILAKETAGGTLRVSADKDGLAASVDLPIEEKPLKEKVLEWRALIYTVIAGAVVLGGTGGAGLLVHRRRKDEFELKEAELDHLKMEVSEAVDARLSGPHSTGDARTPVDGATLYEKWKECLTAVAMEKGLSVPQPLQWATLASSSAECVGELMASEEREVVKPFKREVELSFSADLMKAASPPTEGTYESRTEEEYDSDSDMVCRACMGNVKMKCDTCGGEGKATCHACGGAKDGICPRCKGTGKIGCPKCASGSLPPCPKCGGLGKHLAKGWVSKSTGGAMVSDGGRVGTDHAGNRVLTTTSRYQSSTGSAYEDRLVVCLVCGGARYMCPACGNTGGGGEAVPCPDCSATGKGTCLVCNGTGIARCVRCDGSGMATCGSCKGTGRIRTVEGKEHSYTPHWLDEYIMGENKVIGKGTFMTKDESLLEMKETDSSSASAFGSDPGLQNLVKEAEAMHAKWQEQNPGKLLYRTGWRLLARVVTFADVVVPVEGGPKKDKTTTRVAAVGTAKHWSISSPEAGALVAYDKLREFISVAEKHQRSQKKLRTYLNVVLAVEAVVFVVLILGALGMVPIM